MAHLTGFGLENFRVFKEETYFDFAPITVLTGPNNSGKSSLIKAILLLKDNKLTKEIDDKGIRISKLNFSTENNILGDFSNCRSNSSHIESPMIFSIKFHFRYIPKELILKLTYGKDSDDPNLSKLTHFQILDLHMNISIFNFFENENKTWQGNINFSYLKNEVVQTMKESYQLRKNNEEIEHILKSFEEHKTNKYFLEDIFLDDNEITGAFMQKIFPFSKRNTLFWRNSTFFEPMPFPIYKNNYFNISKPLFDYLFLLDDAEIDKIDSGYIGLLDIKFKEKVKSFKKLNKSELSKLSIQEIIDWELHILDNYSFSDGFFIGLGSLISNISINNIFKNYEDKSENVLVKYLSEFKDDLHHFRHLKENNINISSGDVFFEHIIVNGLNKSLNFSFKSIQEIEYLCSVKTEVQRFYSQNNNEIELVNQLNEFKDKFDFDQKKMLDFVDFWFEKFGIKEKLKIQFNNKYKGFEVYFGDKLAADQGYGINQLIPLFLKIILKEDETNHDSGTIDVEDGEETIFRKPNIPSTIIIEEPETNFHPNYQSKLADFLIAASKKFNVQFIIETHSEYLIRKLQYLTAKKEIKPADTVIYYFHHPDQIPEGQKQVKRIDILEDGSLSDDFGPGFFDEADNLALELFKYSKSRKN